MLEDMLQTIQRELHRAEKLLKTVEIDNRGKRKHLVLLGLAEDSERDQNLSEYIPHKLPSWLKLSLERPLELEQVFRPARAQTYTGKHPRPVLIRFLWLVDKEVVLQACEQGGKQTRP